VTAGPKPGKPEAPTPAAPPPTPEAIARSIAGLAARLSELMVKETAMLLSGRAQEVAALVQEKTDLARAYAGRWGQLKAARATLADLPSALREALRIQVMQLSVVAAENEKALLLMQHATDRVVGIVTRAIRQQHAAGMSYTKTKTWPRHLPGLLGVALDRSL
jgi:hypothetical protein